MSTFNVLKKKPVAISALSQHKTRVPRDIAKHLGLQANDEIVWVTWDQVRFFFTKNTPEYLLPFYDATILHLGTCYQFQIVIPSLLHPYFQSSTRVLWSVYDAKVLIEPLK